MSISASIFDFRVASNAKIIPRKSKKDLFNSDISFLGLPFYDTLTFERNFDRMHIVISTAHPGI